LTRNKPLRTADYLGHLAEAINNIQSYTAGMDAAGFKADRKTQDAVIRNLEIIGRGLQQRRQARPGLCAAAPAGALGLRLRVAQCAGARLLHGGYGHRVGDSECGPPRTELSIGDVPEVVKRLE